MSDRKNIMKVLVCGGYSAYSLNLISRLNKENIEVYVITGSTRKSQKRHRDVFQEYNFICSDALVSTAIKNIQPDVIIFMGAQDNGFQWDDENKDSAEFIASFSNIIISAKNTGVKKFIYLSTLSVFDDNKETQIKSDTLATPTSIKHKTFLHCEGISEYYNEKDIFDISIIRIGAVYGSFNKRVQKNNIVDRLLTSAITNKNMVVNESISHHIIYVSDAVDAVIKVILSKVDYRLLYIVPGESITQQEISHNIKDVMISKGDEKPEISLEENQVNNYVYYELDKDIKFTQKYNFSDGIKKTYDLLKSDYKKEKIKKKRIALSGKKLMPFVETLVLFVLVQMLYVLAGDNTLTQNINFYLIYVIIIGVTNGAVQAMIAVFLSIVGNYWIIGNANGFLSIITDYTEYLWSLQILIIGVLVGYMRDKYKRKTTDYGEDNKYLVDELDRLTKINDSNVQAKNIYENRLLNYNDSLAKMYDIVSELDQLEQQVVIFNAVKVIQQIMEADDVAIYMRSGDSGFYRLVAASTDEAKKMGKTISLNTQVDFYDSISRKEIFRNNTMDEYTPMLAGAIYNDDIADLIVMIWGLSFSSVNLYRSNLLAILCRMIERPLTRSYSYMESIYADAYIDGTRILESTAFNKIIDLYEIGQNEGLLEYSLLVVGEKSKSITEILERLIRDTDFIGMTQEEDKYLILLPNSCVEETQIVVNRLAINNVVAVANV
jgi:nucleoside-diphosphate-sugar epimerase